MKKIIKKTIRYQQLNYEYSHNYSHIPLNTFDETCTITKEEYNRYMKLIDEINNMIRPPNGYPWEQSK